MIFPLLHISGGFTGRNISCFKHNFPPEFVESSLCVCSFYFLVMSEEMELIDQWHIFNCPIYLKGYWSWETGETWMLIDSEHESYRDVACIKNSQYITHLPPQKKKKNKKKKKKQLGGAARPTPYQHVFFFFLSRASLPLPLQKG